MPQSFVHLILTRFNTSVAFAPSGKRLEAEWLNRRLTLFDRYCLPSVRAQRNASFTWLVFFDAATPAWFRERLQSLRPVFTPIYVEGHAADEVIKNKVAESSLVTAPYLITTRLDNDDALASNHISSVQRAFAAQEREFIEFPFGLQSFRGYLYNVFWRCNPFLSLIEKVGKGSHFSTVLCTRHDRVRQAGAVRSLIRSPQWLQTLHDDNVANSLRGTPRLSGRTHPNFEVSWPDTIPNHSLLGRLRFSAVAYRSRAAQYAQNSIGQPLW
jgi:hypothetical protein